MASKKPSMATLRETLMEILEGVRDGNIDANRARAAAFVAQTLINSVSVQIEFERLKLADELPSSLPLMPLTPLIETREAREGAK